MDVSLDALVGDSAHRRPRGVPHLWVMAFQAGHGILHFTIEVQPGSEVTIAHCPGTTGKGNSVEI